MSQVLKEECKNHIINAAKEEFLEYGYANASMRRIALKSKMTVGNLYRYFKSKESISEFIVGDTFEMINQTLSLLTNNDISLEARVFAAKYDVRDFKIMLDKLADNLVDIYKKRKIEFNILMMESELNNKLVNWFSNIIKNIIVQNYTVDEYSHQVDILSHSYSISIFHGIRDLFRNSDVSDDSLKKMIKIFFRGYVVILNADILELIGD